MKKERLLSAVAASGVACLLVAATSCEWDRAGDEDTWNDTYNAKYEWVNFSGVYQQTSGWYVVTQFRRPSTSSSSSSSSGSGSSVSGTQTFTISLTNNTQQAFGGSVQQYGASTPIMPGTFSLRGQHAPPQVPNTEVFYDRDRDGFLYSQYSSQIGAVIGFVNYYTGAFSVQFLYPCDGQLSGSYISGTGSGTNAIVVPTPPRPRPGSSQPIYQFLIFQDAYYLRLTDNYGTVYEGRIVTIQSTAGGVDTDIRPGEAVPVVASFEASGDGVTMSGTLEGTYTAAAQDTTAQPLGSTQQDTPSYRGTMENRVIRGVWVEEDGTTGEIEGMSTAPVQINP